MKFLLISSLVFLMVYKTANSQIHFTHITDQPVFSYGASGQWDAGAVWNPTVIKDGDTLRMWYTGVNASVWQTDSGKIGYAWSLDGTQWNRFGGNPVITGDLSWEASKLFGCAVIKDGDTFKMWYGAGGTPATKIGYATSIDGITWNKYSVPVLITDSTPNWGYSIITPQTVIKEDNIYKMWFWAGKAGFPYDSSVPQIGLATSSDGITWIKYNDPNTTEPEFLSSDPALKVGVPGDWDANRAIDPMVLRTNSGYEMWYVGTQPNPLPPQSIGYATSTDAISWLKCPINPIISTVPIWARAYMGGYYGGTVLKFNDKYHIWYSCFHTPPTEARPQIGYAISQIGNTYPLTALIDRSFAETGTDSVLFTSKFSNIYNHQFTAHLIYANSDSTQIDSVTLLDDGMHGDSLNNDGLYGGYISPRTTEDYYILSVSTFDLELNEYINFSDVGRFTTVPLVINNTQYSSITNHRYSFKPFLKNRSIGHTITNIAVKLTSNDPWVILIFPEQRTCPNLSPGQIAGIVSPFAVSYDSASFPGYFNLTFSVSSTDFSSWVFDTTIVVITDVEDELSELPTEFLLDQNYPNPFNNSCAIKYSIPKSSQVSIKIFNTLGEEIETLVNEEKAVGTYELNWNAANLPSGVYFYRLQAGDFVQTRKMILLK